MRTVQQYQRPISISSDSSRSRSSRSTNVSHLISPRTKKISKQNIHVNFTANLPSTLQNILNKYFDKYKLPTISANELRDLSVQHFSGEGADVRSLQALRNVKQLRRLQSLKGNSFVDLHKKFKKNHLRNQTSNKDII